jgi:hypothetical protein
MAGDATQPRRNMVFACEAGQIAVQFEEDILRHLFGYATVAQDSESNRKDARLMPLQSFHELLPRCVQRERSSTGLIVYTQTGGENDAEIFRAQEES